MLGTQAAQRTALACQSVVMVKSKAKRHVTSDLRMENGILAAQALVPALPFAEMARRKATRPAILEQTTENTTLAARTSVKSLLSVEMASKKLARNATQETKMAPTTVVVRLNATCADIVEMRSLILLMENNAILDIFSMALLEPTVRPHARLKHASTTVETVLSSLEKIAMMENMQMALLEDAALNASGMIALAVMESLNIRKNAMMVS